MGWEGPPGFLKNWELSFSPVTSRVRPEETDIIVEENNVVGDFFWPIIWLLKFAGNCPLSYVYTEGVSIDNRHRAFAWPKRYRVRAYKIHYTSPFTLYCCIQGALAFTVIIIHIYENVSEETIFNSHELKKITKEGVTIMIMFPRPGFLLIIFNARVVLSNYVGGDPSAFEGTAIELMIKTLVCCTPLIQLLGVVLSWVESKDFGIFLNNFHQLQREYLETFPFTRNLPQPNITRVRNMVLLFYVFIPTSFGLPVLVYLGNMSEFSVTGICVSFILVVGITFVSLLEDVKVFLAYYILGDTFRQIKSSIIYSLNNWDNVTPQKVNSWRRLIHGTRQQANCAAKCQKCHQLMLIIGSIVLVTGTIFAVLTESNASPAYPYFLSMQISYAFMIGGRLYLKIYLANLISQEESMIARELNLANFPPNEPAIQLEVQFLHDMIKQNPCLIKFGTYVTLDRNLILGIASQIVTYLIALMQFPSLSFRPTPT